MSKQKRMAVIKTRKRLSAASARPARKTRAGTRVLDIKGSFESRLRDTDPFGFGSKHRY